MTTPEATSSLGPRSMDVVDCADSSGRVASEYAVSRNAETSTEDQLQVTDMFVEISMLYAALEYGWKPAPFTKGRKDFTKMVKAARAQGRDGRWVVREHGQDVYGQNRVDKQATTLVQLRRAERIRAGAIAAGTALAASVVAVGLLGGGGEAQELPAQTDSNSLEVAAAGFLPGEDVEPILITPSTTEKPTTTTQKPTTTTITSTTTEAPTTTATPSTTQPAPPFSYADVQTRGVIEVDQALSRVAKELLIRTKDGDPNHKPTIYRYLDMLVVYNGLPSADDVHAGTEIKFNDCMQNARIVLPGDTLSYIARQVGVPVEEIQSMNGGSAARAVIGTCVRIKQ